MSDLLSINTVFIDKHGCSSVLMLCPLLTFGTVFPYLYTLLTVSLVLDLSSRLICLQDVCSRSTVRASDRLTPLPLCITRSFARYKFVTYLLSYRIRTYSSSRSSKVIDSGVNLKRTCDLLLVINRNLGRISPTVFAILTHKARK